ncbi:MAG: T9SS type A sorting domain-containing protein, partial [Bacteroidales bacterium]
GSLFPEVPDNSATITNVNYIAEHEGRKGVIGFNGKGSQMIAQDGRITFSPIGAMGYNETAIATIASWIYIDEWREDAIILSKYQDEDNNFTVRLGKENTKEIVVDFCGTTATLPGKLQTKKWHYVGVYMKPMIGELTGRTFNPIQISVDYTVYGKAGANKGVVLSGKDMTKNTIPLMSSTPILIGKDFAGKLDEIMVWGADRSGSAENDATNGYKWNQGDWNAIFCNAYWKGDDPENVGKDYQSYRHIIEIMKGYYSGYRGAKVRLGIIYPQGEGWKNVLNKKENVDRLIADAKNILKDSDGLDVDLEWHGYDIVNNVVRRLINEVMAGNEDKIFTVSQHEYSYQLDKSLFPHIDYFTMQMYGPQPFSYDYDWYIRAYNKFIEYGYPKDKLLLSYGVLLVNNGEEGYKDLFEKYGYNDDNFDPELNIWNCNGTLKYFNGVNQTKRKQNFIIDNDCLGTMYFDMANDVYVHDPKSLIRAQNDVLNANVDTLITRVENVPTNLIKTHKNKDSEVFSFYPNPAKEFIHVSLHSEERKTALLEIKTLDGITMVNQKLDENENVISIGNLNRGTYLIQVTSDQKVTTKKLQIN